MAFAEHLTGYFADYGTAATVKGAAVTGIFDDAWQDALGLVAGTQPALLLPTASVGSATVGDSVVVGAVSYTIAGMEPDGTGMTRLRLQEAA